MITLKEIAQEAGVSMTTVSNVLNGNSGRVSTDTAERIQAIMKKSGYVPNQAARSLAQRESHIIAVIVQASPGENIFRNPYTAEYVGALTLELQQNGYYPLIRFSDNYKEIDADLRGWNVAGVIFSGAYNRHLHTLRSLTDIPTFFTDCYVRIPGANHVGMDDDAGGQLAGEYLIRMGHRRIGFLGNNVDESDVDRHRLEGFRAGLAEGGVELADDFILRNREALFPPEPLRKIMELPDRPTAFFCTSDLAAVQLMQAFSQLGFRVPDDVSVLGFDDLPLATQVQPALTTLAQDISQKAHLVVDMLLRHIRQRALAPERTLLGTWLVERQSVRRLEPAGKQADQLLNPHETAIES